VLPRDGRRGRARLKKLPSLPEAIGSHESELFRGLLRSHDWIGSGLVSSES